jgi:hypothetical protein
VAQITIQGKRVTVSDNFFQLTPEEQDATVDEIARGMSAGSKTTDSAKAAVPEGKSVGGFLQNIPKDAYNIASGVVGGLYAGGRKLITDPVGAGKDVLDFADRSGAAVEGGAANLYNMLVPEALETPGRTPEMEMASQVGGALKDRYYDNLGDTVYNEPVQSAMDAATLLYGGQGLAAGALGKGAMLTKTLGKAAEITNPLNVVAKPIQAARGALAERSAMKAMRDTAPSLDQVVGRKNQLYNALDNAGIKFDANTYGQMMQSIAGKIRTFRERRAPMTRDLAENVMMKFYGQSPSFRDVEEMLIEAKSILRVPDNASPTAATDKAAARLVLDEVSQFFDNAPVMSNGSIPADQISAVAKEARDLARRHIIAREVAEMDRKSGWYLSGEESGIRNQFSSFGKRQGEHGLTDVEKKAAKKVVRREGLHGLASTSGSKLVQAMLLGGAGFGLGGPIGATVGLGASTLSRAASAAMTNRKLDQFRKTVLAGREAQQKALLEAKRLPVKTKGLLLGTEGAGLLTGRQ